MPTPGDIARAVADNDAVGYSQYERLTVWEDSPWGGTPRNVDCSELVSYCFDYCGIPAFPQSTWTGSVVYWARQYGGFEIFDYSADYDYRDSDILLTDGHVAIVSGDDICEAWIAETGDIYGERGDQTGQEVRVTGFYDHPYLHKWDTVLRYTNIAGDDFDMTSEDREIFIDIRDRLREISDQTGTGIEGRRYDGPIVSRLKNIEANTYAIWDLLAPGREGKRAAGSVFQALWNIGKALTSK